MARYGDKQRIIPPHWGQRLQPLIETGMTSECEIIAPGKPSRDNPLAGATPTVMYSDIPCRVQQQNRFTNGATPTGQDSTRRDYLVQIPARIGQLHEGMTGWIIHVTRTDDAGMLGRQFKIKQELHGSEIGARDLICEDSQTQNGR